MAYKDTGGSLTLRGVTFVPHAVAVASVYAVALEGPPDGTRVPALAVPLSVLVSSASGLNTDVALEVATSSGFGGTVVYSNTLTNRANGQHSVTVSGLSNLVTYFWRARAAETGTTSWAAWTPVRTFIPDLNAGKGFLYSVFNAGVSLTSDRKGFGYNVENVGAVYALSARSTNGYSVFNVGVFLVKSGRGSGYAAEGDVSANPPFPHVWFLRPASGREGDGIRIVCFGVGALATTWAGSVELYYGPTLGWVTVPVTAWNTYPPTPNAYTADRRLDPPAFHIDMQHTIIDVVVPVGALPPGYPLRVRTVTP